MKKIILLFGLSFLFANSHQAQSFTLSNKVGALTHDTTFEVFALPDQEYVKAHVYMTNVSNDTIKLLVKKKEIEILDGTVNTFCFNNSCFPPNVIVAPYPLTLSPGETSGDNDFYGDYFPGGQVGSSVIQYTFFNAQNVEDSISVSIKYTTRYESILLSNSQGALAHNAIFEIFASPDDDVIKAHIFITNMSSDTLRLLVKKDEIEVLENTFNTFCWNSQCYPPDVIISPDTMALAPEATTSESDFYGEYIPNGQEGITMVRYTVFNSEQPLDSISVIVKYNTTNVGIGPTPAVLASRISHPFPNPVSFNISFDLDLHPQVTNASIVFRNLLGAEVMRYHLNERKGRVTIPVDNLKEGFYFYTLTIEGNYPLQTGKFIVKRR